MQANLGQTKHLENHGKRNHWAIFPLQKVKHPKNYMELLEFIRQCDPSAIPMAISETS